MKMTCERFREQLDLYIDSELPVDERRAMEEHALSCVDCAALLDLALAQATVCAEMNEGLTVPAAAKAAWREAVRAEAEASVPRADRRSRRRAPRAHTWARVLYAAAAVLIVCLAVGPMLSGMNLDALTDARTAGPASLKGNAAYDAGYGYEDGLGKPVSAPNAVVYEEEADFEYAYSTADTTAVTGFRLQSDGAVGEDRSVGAGKQDSGVIVLRSATRRAKTKTFDDALLWLDDLLHEYGAYFEERSVSGQPENKNRTLYASIRVPSESLDDFLIALDELGTVTLREEYAEDITANYTDVAARLGVLRSQLEQLEAMNQMAESVSDLVEIHARATELMSEIESYESTIRGWDSRRSYSSVSLTLNETADVIETPETTLTERMKNAFAESLDWLRDFGKNAAVFCAALAPRLVVIVPVLIVVIVLLRLAFGRKKKK